MKTLLLKPKSNTISLSTIIAAVVDRRILNDEAKRGFSSLLRLACGFSCNRYNVTFITHLFGMILFCVFVLSKDVAVQLRQAFPVTIPAKLSCPLDSPTRHDL